ncbi:hypothetical protein WNY58_04385 [Neptuniibacter pectenicola]|uniref:Uncharacterized protein n=1 Tax=Neptuniibacter pectenicola TaxID=1806669 RepID=A0ABU9TPH4_9GAMM
MTNSHSIKELEVFEEAMQETTKAANQGLEVSNILITLSERFSDLLPELTLKLLNQDIQDYEKTGRLVSSAGKQLLAEGKITFEDLNSTELSPSVKALNSAA